MLGVHKHFKRNKNSWLGSASLHILTNNFCPLKWALDFFEHLNFNDARILFFGEIIMEEKILTDQTTKSFFVKISQVDRIFNSNRDLGLFLWRATRTDSNIANPLFPDFHPREIRPGQFREPDVTIKSVSGVDHIFPVVHKSGPNSIWKAQGTSLFNEENTFPSKKWEYFEIPKGTKIPNGILIIKMTTIAGLRLLTIQ
jgi:hypothetical protein